MFSAYKVVLLALIASWSSMVFAQTSERYGALVGNCSDANECVVSINDHVPARDALCNSSDFSVLWTPGTERYLVQCRNGDTAEDNVVWIVDPTVNLFGKLNYGRFIKKITLEKTPNIEIPDKFRSRSLCSPIDMSKLNGSDFVLLDKKPDAGDNPYCYDPTYLTIRRGKLVIDSSSGPVTHRDSDHAVHTISARERDDLNHLLDAVRQWRP